MHEKKDSLPISLDFELKSNEGIDDIVHKKDVSVYVKFYLKITDYGKLEKILNNGDIQIEEEVIDVLPNPTDFIIIRDESQAKFESGPNKLSFKTHVISVSDLLRSSQTEVLEIKGRHYSFKAINEVIGLKFNPKLKIAYVKNNEKISGEILECGCPKIVSFLSYDKMKNQDLLNIVKSLNVLKYKLQHCSISTIMETPTKLNAVKDLGDSYIKVIKNYMSFIFEKKRMLSEHEIKEFNNSKVNRILGLVLEEIKILPYHFLTSLKDLYIETDAYDEKTVWTLIENFCESILKELSNLIYLSTEEEEYFAAYFIIDEIYSQIIRAIKKVEDSLIEKKINNAVLSKVKELSKKIENKKDIFESTHRVNILLRVLPFFKL